ncbi:hypothetical protein R55210_AODCCCNP_01160 [Fructobacillus fructosus]|uniref:hypothetical protein n=1 Tax=Fructobacillus fructosus TaxID=1631 RepID=UPI002DAEAD47|nr:hypothetical protein R55210_AODCCCNP_01160 [Fructobacillus fructosus]
MTEKKFTEKQYQEIVETQKDYFPNNLLGLGTNGEYFIESLSEEIVSFAVNHDLENKMLAIANPLTREWAHDKFVEKENKYYWKTTKTDRHEKPRLLAKDEDGAIYFIGRVMKLGHTSKITETELREWGYNPDMFEKEEVEW